MHKTDTMEDFPEKNLAHMLDNNTEWFHCALVIFGNNSLSHIQSHFYVPYGTEI